MQRWSGGRHWFPGCLRYKLLYLTIQTFRSSEMNTRIWYGMVWYGMVWYGMVFKYLYSAPQRPWANRGAFGSISSKK